MKKTIIFISSLILANSLSAASSFQEKFAFERKELKEYELKPVTIDVSKHGILGTDNIPDSERINKLISYVNKNEMTTLQFGEGTYILDKSLEINKSNIKFIGAGKDKTKFIYTGTGFLNKAAFDIKGYKGRRIGITTALGFDQNIAGEKFLLMKPDNPDKHKNFFEVGAKATNIWLAQKNDFNELEKKFKSKWLKETPYVFQEINAIEYCEKKQNKEKRDNIVFLCKLKNDLNHSYSVKNSIPTTVYTPRLIENIYIKDLSVEYKPNNKDLNFDFDKNKFVYDEINSDYNVDLISANFATNLNVENVELINAGKNPMVLDTVKNSLFNNIIMNNVINKDLDNGSFVINRTYNSEFKNITLKNLKYFLVSWATASNRFEDIYMNAPLYLKGGMTRNNIFSRFHITLEEGTPFTDLYENISTQNDTVVPNFNSDNVLNINSFKVKDLRLIKF